MCWWNTMKKTIPDTSKNNRSETQKLYRHVQQISQRLDLQLQQAMDWREWFDVETLQLRQRVRDVCEHLLLSGECDIARKTEEYLWRKSFYDIIQKLKMDKKALSTNDILGSVYTSHLQSALGFYHRLLVKLRNRYAIALNGIIDWIGSPCESDLGVDVTQEQKDWAFKACQRCLIYLGDIARYQLDVTSQPDEGQAERYYHLAILLDSSNGMPHNQIGTLKLNESLLCESCYHYMCCVLSESPFEGSEENLKRALEKHNQNFATATEEHMSNNTVMDMKSQFTSSFLSLQEILFGFRNISTLDLSQWCQSLLSQFAIVLNAAFYKDEEDAITPTNARVNGDFGGVKLMNGTGNHVGLNHVNGKEEEDEEEEEDVAKAEESLHLTCASLVKMFGMNILDVVKLKSIGSEITCAATAFTAALLSQLLDFISQYLNRYFPFGNSNTDKTKEEEEKKKEISDDYEKMKRKILINRRKRKRRHRLTSQNSDATDDEEEAGSDHENNEDDLSDLSEGELDTNMDDDSSDDSDSIIEENSDEEIAPIATTPTATTTRSIDDMKIDGYENNGQPRNGIVNHNNNNNNNNNNMKKKFSILSKAGILLNKQLKKNNHKVHIPTTPTNNNGISVSDYVLEDVEFIQHAARLLDDFEELNEHAYLPVIKILFDWMKINPDVLKMTGKASPVLWQRLAEVLNSLPSQKVVQIAVMYFSQRRKLPLWLKGDLEGGGEMTQKRALPEDVTLFGTPGFQELHDGLDVTWFRGLSHSELYQFALRVTYLRNFGHFVSSSEDVPCFSWEEEGGRFVVTKTVDDEVVTLEKEMMKMKTNGHTQMNVAQKKHMMKALAKQKLKHDVNELQKQLKSSSMSPGRKVGNIVYLVLDTPALCRHLSLLRSLVKSAQFVVIVPMQVIAALDELKKFNPGARDAIKFLEDEIKHGNRWLKTQKEHETVSNDQLSSNHKKKNRDIEEWRFLHIVKCCLYFSEQHAGGQSLVTLLTSESSLNGGRTANLGTRPSPQALEICTNKGIRVEPVVDFYKRWSARNGPS
jgi:protein SMG5